jgi:hypothetical protein
VRAVLWLSLSVAQTQALMHQNRVSLLLPDFVAVWKNSHQEEVAILDIGKGGICCCFLCSDQKSAACTAAFPCPA